MDAKFLIPLIAATLFTLSAHAHDCSGGTNGGMDATGNECNDAVAIKTDISPDGATSSSARLPKAETDKASSGNECAAKRTFITRHAAAHHQIKHG